MQLYVGASSLRGDIARYGRTFNMLELRAELGKLPRPALLRQWTSKVPEQFAFSIMLGRAASSLMPGEQAEQELDYALKALDALNARWFIVQTPPAVTPSSRSKRALTELVQKLPRDKARLAWEPRGLWQDDELVRWASELELHLVRDVTRDPAPPGDVVYCRLLALGGGSALSSGAAENVVETLAHTEQAYVVIEGDGAMRGAQRLRAAAQLELEMDELES